MASFAQRGDKWQAKVRVTGQPQRTKTFDTRAQAEKWAAGQEGAIAEGPTLGDLLRRYIKDIAPGLRSGAWQTRVLRRIMREEKAMCSLAAGKLGKSHLSEWRDRRVKEVLGSSFGRELDAIAAVFNVAIADEWEPSVTVNPVKGFRRPPLPLPRDVRLAAGDDQRLIDAALEFNREIAPAIVLAIETSMRQGEIASLRWENIDLENRTALLPLTKNGTARKVPLSSKALEALTWCPPPHKGKVFKLTQSAMKYAFVQVRKQCGLGNVHFHDLRHEAVSRLFEKGLNVMEVAACSGHKSLKHLQRYTHLRAEDIARKLD